MLEFNQLVEHTKSINNLARSVVEDHLPQWEEAIEKFSQFFEKLKETDSIESNVKMVLSIRFLNHVYSSLKLTESGLLVDAAICERSAVETLAGYKLVSVSSEMAEKYNKGSLPSPIDVRMELEKHGYKEEAERIRDFYKTLCGITHLARDHERFTINWETDKDGILLTGGTYEEADVIQMVEFLPSLIHWYLLPMEAFV